MNVYTVSYDLFDGDREDYEDLYEAIESYEIVARILESTWVIATDNMDASICNYLKSFLGPSDKIFVARVAPGVATVEVSSANLNDETMQRLENVLWWQG